MLQEEGGCVVIRVGTLSLLSAVDFPTIVKLFSRTPMKSTTITRNFTLEARQELLRDQGGACHQVWVARCLELDIVVQGKSLDELRDKFVNALNGHILIATECGLDPFDCLPVGRGEIEEMEVKPITSFSIADVLGRNTRRLLDKCSIPTPRGQVTLQVA